MIKLLLLFALVPIVEIYILIELGAVIGSLPTILLIAFTGFVGVLLAKAQGLAVFYNMQRDMDSGVVPGDPLFDGACILVGAAFLLTPGLVTDLFGFSLLVPFTRAIYKNVVQSYMYRRQQEGTLHVWRR